MDIHTWLSTLGLDEAEAMMACTEQYRESPLNDTALRSYARFLDEMKRLGDRTAGLTLALFFVFTVDLDKT